MKIRFLTFAFSLGVFLALSGAPAAAGSAPVIESESVSHLRPTDATLEAQINPEGLETSYRLHVEYQCGLWGEVCAQVCSPKPWWEGCISAVGIQLPGRLEASSEPQSIRVDLNEAGVTLHPGTWHFYWIEATNSAGMSKEWPVGFSTPTTGPPEIESQAVSNVSSTDATLEAWINPGGMETSYEFELVERWNCEKSSPACEPPIFELPLPAGQLPASYERQHVSIDLNDAGVTLGSINFYEFAVRASNAAGTARGPVREFAPAPFPPEGTEPPSHEGPSGASQEEENAPASPPPAGGPIQGPPKAALCHRAPRHHHAKHRRHRRVSIGKACRWA